jgi:glycosyltransferase involved in cell wall biosynthesis
MPRNNTPLFSVVVANYNNGSYLDEMVQSLLLQTWTNWELIFIDDGSTDQSLSILEKYAEEDERIKVFKNELNKGAAACLNIALERAKGEIIGRLDSDDKLSPDAIECMVSAHIDNKKASLICSHSYSWKPNSETLERWPGYTNPGTTSLIFGCTVGHFATWKKIASDNIDRIDEALKKAVDLDLYLKLEEVGTVSFFDKPLYFYRQHDGGISQGESGMKANQYAIQATLAAYRRRKGTKKANLRAKEYRILLRTWYFRECHPLRWVHRKKCNELLMRGLLKVPSILFTQTFWSIVARNNFLKP